MEEQERLSSSVAPADDAVENNVAPLSGRKVRFSEDDDANGDDEAAAPENVKGADGPPPLVVLHEIPNREDWNADDLMDLFFSRSEYQKSRLVAKHHSREMDRRGDAKQLVDCFAEKNYRAQNSLNLWASGDHDCRGLERWSNKDHGDVRQQEQFSAIMAILQAQEEMRTETNSVDPENLRKIAGEASRTARHFARMMGKADSYVVALYLKEDAEFVESVSSFVPARTIDYESLAYARKLPSMNDEDDDEDSHTEYYEARRSSMRSDIGANTSLLTLDEDVDVDLPHMEEIEEVAAPGLGGTTSGQKGFRKRLFRRRLFPFLRKRWDANESPGKH